MLWEQGQALKMRGTKRKQWTGKSLFNDFIFPFTKIVVAPQLNRWSKPFTTVSHHDSIEIKTAFIH